MYLSGLACLVTVEHFVVVQSISCVWLFVTPWTAAHQASLSFTISQSLLRLTSIESVIPSNHLILCRPLLLVLNPHVSGVVGLGLVSSSEAPEAHRTSSHAPSTQLWALLGQAGSNSSLFPGSWQAVDSPEIVIKESRFSCLPKALPWSWHSSQWLAGWLRGRPLWKPAVPGLGDTVGRAGLPDLDLCSTT